MNKNNVGSYLAVLGYFIIMSIVIATGFYIHTWLGVFVLGVFILVSGMVLMGLKI